MQYYKISKGKYNTCYNLSPNGLFFNNINKYSHTPLILYYIQEEDNVDSITKRCPLNSEPRKQYYELFTKRTKLYSSNDFYYDYIKYNQLDGKIVCGCRNDDDCMCSNIPLRTFGGNDLRKSINASPRVLLN